MNRIGIFGDSFADPFMYIGIEKHYNPVSWPFLLSKRFNVPVIDGVPCTSIFYSYNQFLENYKNLEIIILVLTEPNRLYNSDMKLKLGDFNTVQSQLQSLNEKHPNYIYYKAAELFHLWLSEPKLNNFIFTKCVESIQNICQKESKKLILVPGFQNTVDYAEYFKTSLIQISEKEFFTQFNTKRWEFKKERITRACHLSAKNNLVLADFLSDIINGENKTIGLEDFAYDIVSNPEDYWELV